MSGRKKGLTSRAAKAQAHHAIRRARERLGLQLDMRDLRAIVGQIAAEQEAELVQQGAEGKRLYHVRYGARHLAVVYDSRNRSICTFVLLHWRLLEFPLQRGEELGVQAP